jgi:hypothetical protein
MRELKQQRYMPALSEMKNEIRLATLGVHWRQGFQTVDTDGLEITQDGGIALKSGYRLDPIGNF